MIRKAVRRFSISFAAFCAGALFMALPVTAQTATLLGTVTHAGAQPGPAIDMDADPSCAELHDEPVLYDTMVTDGEGHLGSVFVYLKEGSALRGHPVPEEPHLLDQVGCQYTPHVSGMQVGQRLIMRNSDMTLHNVHSLPEKNREFNYGQPFEGMEIEHVFESGEVMVRFKCDVHSWMTAYVGVLAHPFFAVTAEDGSFSIEGIPPGSYTLEAWHEGLGTQTVTVTLQESQTEEVTIDF